MSPLAPSLTLTISTPPTTSSPDPLPSGTPTQTPTIHLTTTNASPTTTYTLLTYSSPLDPLAFPLGLLSLTLLPLPSSSTPSPPPPPGSSLPASENAPAKNTQEEETKTNTPPSSLDSLPLNNIMLRRMIPPPHEALITLSPKQKHVQEIILRPPTLDIKGLEAQGVSLGGRDVRVEWVGRGWGVDGGVLVWNGERGDVLRGVEERGEDWEEGGERWVVDGEGVVRF
ncbi:hypothetical protein QBC34DRAFT_379337 [Podospora aff. communis PSN243]|uniref:Uncharacterized protein n=1 Tax=Podospora aff. communis PSN243 TaxID=3040156 RepID=A0AAV9GTC9_9PEZI|nr:hypothetical protein QBC34DRAFT_379337 [Podospora aff. communis PSN243]